MSKRSDMADTSFNPLNMHREKWPESYDAQMFPLVIALLQAHAAHHSHATMALAASGLSLVEFDVLASLRRSPPPHALTPSELQRAMLITSGGLTKVLQQLEMRGFVSRSTDDADRRVKPVALTDQAMPVLEIVMSESHTIVGGWIRQALTGAEIKQLTLLLTKLVNTPSSS
jgi:DNA-binding MarR family transcriptional regulator